MRAYTINEIDDLRQAIRDHELWGSYSGPKPVGIGEIAYGCSRPFHEPEMTNIVERRVRTCMMAGLTVDDLKA